MYDSRVNIAGWILLAGLRLSGREPSRPDERPEGNQATGTTSIQLALLALPRKVFPR